MLKILTVLGARPQFVKAAAVSREFAKYPDISEIIVHTGQHWDENMSDIFFREMEIPTPDYNLAINNLSHGAMTGQMLEGIEKIIIEKNPDFIMIYGDTNSTLAGALAAKKLHKKVIHVEAGLRSFNMEMPEEINRILTDRISDILFCPTDNAVENLNKEGFRNFPCQIIQNGDVMQDAAMYYSKKSAEKSSIISEQKLEAGNFVLCTLHRQENTDSLENLTSIINALNRINKETPIVLPLHPRTKKILKQNNITKHPAVIDPVGYFDMLELLKKCAIVMTDSGGLQKEAFFFQKHCVTIREQTEWVELVDHGFNIIAGTNENTIFECYKKMIQKSSNFDIDLYGRGLASQSIAQTILK